MNPARRRIQVLAALHETAGQLSDLSRVFHDESDTARKLRGIAQAAAGEFFRHVKRHYFDCSAVDFNTEHPAQYVWDAVQNWRA